MQTGPTRFRTLVKTGWLHPLLIAGFICMTAAGRSVSAAEMTAPASAAWFVKMDQYAAGAHGTLKCEECHGPMTEMKQGKVIPHPNPDAPDYLKIETRRTFDYQTCAKCHKTAHDRFLKGAHAEAAIKEKAEKKPSDTGFAPTCGDCHSAHYAVSHKSRARLGKEMTESCGDCHPDQKKSFLANYHGKAAVNLGYDKAAFCTDCHGAHTTLSLKDKDQVLTACRRCHPDAKPAFADIIIHDSQTGIEAKSESKQAGLKWVHWLGSLSVIFVAGVLVFFYAHTGLLMLRKLHETLRRHK